MTDRKVWWLPWEPIEVARRMHESQLKWASQFGFHMVDEKFDPDSDYAKLGVTMIRDVLIEQASDYIDDLTNAESYIEAIELTLDRLGFVDSKAIIPAIEHLNSRAKASEDKVRALEAQFLRDDNRPSILDAARAVVYGVKKDE